jgi:hypothetical protein
MVEKEKLLEEQMACMNQITSVLELETKLKELIKKIIHERQNNSSINLRGLYSEALVSYRKLPEDIQPKYDLILKQLYKSAIVASTI